ncbi:MAG: mechanosensitive ion channel domain-containing protein [Gammaproteobacteria bacterium]
MYNNSNNASGRALPFLGALMAIALVISPVAGAQDAEPAEASALTPLPSDVAENLQKAFDRIGARRVRIDSLEELLAANDGDAEKLIFGARLDRAWIDLLEDGFRFLSAVVDARNAGHDIAKWRSVAEQVLDGQGEVGGTAWRRVRDVATLPAADLSAAEQAAAYARLFDLQETTDRIFDTYLTGIELAAQLDIDMSADIEAVKVLLAERARNVSVFLELSVDHASGARAGAEALPADAELQARASVADARVQSAAQALERVVGQMEAFGLETAEFREQVLTSTGAVTTDVFDFKIIRNLLSRWGQSLLDYFVEEGPTFLFQVLIFFAIIFVARKLAVLVAGLVERALNRTTVRLSLLLKRMIASSVRNGVLILGVLVALSQVGISLGPVLAGLGIAGFVIGFALQDTLSNFASGMMILFYRPFDVGDVVEVGGVFGKVSAMSLVNTTVLTLDNQTIVMPNNMIWGGVIKNLNEQRHRRVDLTFGVSYSDDIPKVEKILTEIIDAHDKVLADPEPTIRLHELADSSVNFIVRPWVESDDYWDVYWDVMREVKMRFDAEGISIPFPQQDVHIVSGDFPVRAESA